MDLICRSISDHPMLEPLTKIGIGTHLNISSGGWISGSYAALFLTNGEWNAESDIDIFCANKYQASMIGDRILNIKTHTPKTALSDWSGLKSKSTYGDDHTPNPKYNLEHNMLFSESDSKDSRKIQIINVNFYKNVRDLLEDIDFTICRVATDGRVIVYDSRAPDDLKNKIIRPVVSKRTNNSAKRYYKYIHRGFTPAPGMLSWPLDLDNDATQVETAPLRVKGNWNAY